MVLKPVVGSVRGFSGGLATVVLPPDLVENDFNEEVAAAHRGGILSF
jgi:hypothetical protein